MIKTTRKVKLSMPTTIGGVDFKTGDELSVGSKKSTVSNEVTITEKQADIMLKHGFIDGE
jgi:hypothetical protein